MSSPTNAGNCHNIELIPTRLCEKSVHYYALVIFYVSIALMALALYSPAANAADQTVTVKVRGNLGTESAYLNINGSRATEWQVSNGFQTFSFTTSQDINKIRVGHNSGGWPSAVIVDYIEVDGSRYQSEDPARLSWGSWNQTDRCAQGYKRSEWLSCDGGYFDYDIGSNVVAVRARGNLGTENVDLIINGSQVASWQTTNNHQTFEYRTNQNVDSIEVQNNNGGWPHAVIVDYVDLNGKRYESENSSTHSYGS